MSAVGSEHASVLVVDDNPLIVQCLTSLLGNSHYQVFVSKNGEEALDLLGKKSVDVVICDVMMPKMDGFQLHELVRKRPEYSHIPFVFLTALGDEEHVQRGRETGADDYLTKPFDPRELLALVRGKITRSRSLRDQSEEKFETFRKRVIHTLSHEFRTPLVAINTGAELLLEQPESDANKKARQLLEAIQRGGRRLERLVNDFMMLQQIEAGIADRVCSSRKTLHRVSEILRVFIENSERMVNGEGGKLVFTDHTAGASVLAYDVQIHDILLRLLQNALKFSPSNKTVEIVACADRDVVTIEMRDRGIGMNLDRVHEAIDIFGQIDREKLEQQGGGLGLAIASRYANLNGGRLEFEHRKGGGTTVTIVLPRPKDSPQPGQ